MKKFKYTRITESCYLSGSDEYEKFGDDFYYEASDSDMLPHIVDFVYEDYFKDLNVEESVKKSIKNNIESMITDCDLIDALSDVYEDGLKEVFKDDAKSWYRN